MNLYGGRLMDAMAQRIIARYLRHSGGSGVMAVDMASDPQRFAGVDLVYSRAGKAMRVKVKPDTYFGTDPRKIADQERPFYRNQANAYAFETISHHVTRDPGWMFNSVAEELYYYFIAIDQTEQDISALMEEPDEVFFSELAVERDELHILPFDDLRQWFEANHERYMPRPVRIGDHSGWYRIVPVKDIREALPGVQVKGSVFAGAAQG